MNIQSHIIKILTILNETHCGLTRQQLQDILTGKETNEIQELEYDQLESFGIAEDNDETDWNAIIDTALKEQILRVKNQKAHTISYSPEGKKYYRRPHPVFLGDDDEQDYNGQDDANLQAIMRASAADQSTAATTARPQFHSQRTALQVKLIHAVDRKQDLDQFAIDQNVTLDEVMDNLFTLRHMGKNLNIRYFITQVIDGEDINEFRDYISQQPFDMDTALQDWGDVYNPEELRLLQYYLTD